MNLKRQLLLVSVLTLVLPWAGYQFIQETESALRIGQQQSLASIAQAHANSLSQYVEEFPAPDSSVRVDDQLYLHPLLRRPSVDGYVDDWSISAESLRKMHGPDGLIQFAVARFGNDAYLYVEVEDKQVVYAATETPAINAQTRFADRVTLVSSNPPYLEERFVFAAEAPGPIISLRSSDRDFAREPAISAIWQDTPKGYRIEARLPLSLLGTNIGIAVDHTAADSNRGTRISSYRGDAPAVAANQSVELTRIAVPLVPSDMRLLITDASGWRLTSVGQLARSTEIESLASATSRRIYGWLVESGVAADFAEPDASGRERQGYISTALRGEASASWFRSEQDGRAIVAVAAPVLNDDTVLGAVVLQQSTDAILSLTNDGLARLMKVTLIATLLAAGALLGYATWLSRRVRHLSVAAENALESEQLQTALPSALAGDEIGDLSRSFSTVLRQLDDYNAYLRSLASKLSHELRTPLAIVTSSLENLEHEALSDDGLGYTARAREGADRLRRILSAMSEASRVEELMKNADLEAFDIAALLRSIVSAYQDAFPARRFVFDSEHDSLHTHGSPELLIQMLDKLIDNAVDFSEEGDELRVILSSSESQLLIDVTNPGPPLPEQMQAQLFDSMVSLRSEKNSRHLGLGLYIAKLIADGHGGKIIASNTDNGAKFSVALPR